MSFLKRMTWKRKGLIDVKSEYEGIQEIQNSERQFFDRKVKKEIGSGGEISDAENARAWLDFFGLRGGLRGMHVLECGCGTGKFTAVLAEQGANMKAFDISPKSVEITERRLKRSGLDNVQVDVAAMEELPYEDESFDLVVGLFILHHLADLERGIREVGRVLKPGGKAIFYETSASNPVLMFARRNLAGRWGIPKLGTLDEHPLTRVDLEIISSTFQGKTGFLHPQFRFFGKLHFQLFRHRKNAKLVLEGIDRLIYRCFPFVRKYSYQVMITLRKTSPD